MKTAKDYFFGAQVFLISGVLCLSSCYFAFQATIEAANGMSSKRVVPIPEAMIGGAFVATALLTADAALESLSSFALATKFACQGIFESLKG